MKRDIDSMSPDDLRKYVQNLRKMIHTLQETVKKLTIKTP